MARSETRAMKAARSEFFAEGKKLDADPATRHLANCWLCKQRIDYTVPPSTTPDSHNLDHFHPVATHPELQHDTTGFRHSHFSCNASRGSRAPSAGLGDEVDPWW
ncbi:hypothetical protein [Cellulosimicrobium funkei]|uniref:hypothetical protein n=1 Tax=Cellulosimicrobium funkei TaxID=264251 RepID=UPI0036BB63F4